MSGRERRAARRNQPMSAAKSLCYDALIAA